MDNNTTTLEVIAESVDEAVEKGLQDLGVSRNQVEIEILDQGNQGGLLGFGSRQARIRIKVKSAGTPSASQPQVTEPQTAEPQAAEPSTDQESVPPPGEEDEYIRELAEDVVSELIEKMNLQAQVQATLGEPVEKLPFRPIRVEIHGDDLSVLIGRRAETLNALQYVTRLIMGKELERGVPLSIDVEGYRDRREQQVRQIAQRVAQQVKDTQRHQALEPMPANERRFAHIELREDPGVYTESAGEEPHRKVVVYPAQ
jgi:spoIIIJ-associated protein